MVPRGENPGLLFSTSPRDYLLTHPPLSQRPIDSSFSKRGSIASSDFLPPPNSNSNYVSHRHSAPGTIISSNRIQSESEAPHESKQDQERLGNTHFSSSAARSDEAIDPLDSTQSLHLTDIETAERSSKRVVEPVEGREGEETIQNQTVQNIQSLTSALAAKVTESLKIGSSDQGLAKALDAVKGLQRMTSDQGGRTNSQSTGYSDRSQVPELDRATPSTRRDELESDQQDGPTKIASDASKSLEAQVQQILQAGLSNLMNQHGSNFSRTRISPSRTNRSSSKHQLKCNETGCGKILPRHCDMKY